MSALQAMFWKEENKGKVPEGDYTYYTVNQQLNEMIFDRMKCYVQQEHHLNTRPSNDCSNVHVSYQIPTVLIQSSGFGLETQLVAFWEKNYWKNVFWLYSTKTFK